MSRNYATSRSRIRRMCSINEVKEKDLYEKKIRYLREVSGVDNSKGSD